MSSRATASPFAVSPFSSAALPRASSHRNPLWVAMEQRADPAARWREVREASTGKRQSPSPRDADRRRY